MTKENYRRTAQKRSTSLRHAKHCDNLPNSRRFLGQWLVSFHV